MEEGGPLSGGGRWVWEATGLFLRPRKAPGLGLKKIYTAGSLQGAEMLKGLGYGLISGSIKATGLDRLRKA
jgi:hypothetical protein